MPAQISLLGILVFFKINDCAAIAEFSPISTPCQIITDAPTTTFLLSIIGFRISLLYSNVCPLIEEPPPIITSSSMSINQGSLILIVLI